MAKKDSNFISARESRRISKANAKITKKLDDKLNRKHVSESEYLTKMHDEGNVVEFDDLHTCFFTDVGTVKAVDGVSFNVPVGKTVGIVGESGCGKSVTSLSLMQLLQRPSGQIVSGEIRLNLGDKAYDVAQMPIKAMEKIRGNVVSMIFQEPMTSLNPVFRIGAQVDEVIALHDGEGKSEDEIRKAGFDAYFVDHTAGIYPASAAGVPFNAFAVASKGDAVTDLHESMAAEQKARTTYDNILRFCDDPDVIDPIRFLRAREVVHYQRFGENLRLLTDKLDSKNFYAFNPSFDKKCFNKNK